MNNLLDLDTRIKNILVNQNNELTAMQVLLIELEKSPIKNWSDRTLKGLSDSIGYNCYYKKDNVDVLTKFSLNAKQVDNYGYLTNNWLEFNVFTCDELVIQLKDRIKYKEEYIEKTKKTIKSKKKIIKMINKIIELKKELGYEFYNSEIVNLLINKNIDSYYFKR